MPRTPAHIVLIGPPRCGTTSVGAKLARRICRPFLDVDASPLRQEDVDDPTDPAARDAADVEWFQHVVATSGPLVIAAPWSALDSVVDAAAQHRVWTVWLDAPDQDLLARAASTTTDPERFERYLGDEADRKRSLAAQVADEVFDTGGAEADVVATEIADRWSSRV